MTPLDPQEVHSRLAKLKGWTLAADGKAIEKRFSFHDFSQAFAFMTRAALAAEKLNHHPDWSNAYNRVDVRLSTHSAAAGRGGLTDLDFTFAQTLDTLM
ncbi:MAG: 4a-hydroxytetrahydrobiopterin dehydratase [Rhodospirillales bacterium]|nr:4a-hydroxytetrahydrobiopterin dehydratase [Rhodospirillales bacterium]